MDLFMMASCVDVNMSLVEFALVLLCHFQSLFHIWTVILEISFLRFFIILLHWSKLWCFVMKNCCSVNLQALFISALAPLVRWQEVYGGRTVKLAELQWVRQYINIPPLFLPSLPSFPFPFPSPFSPSLLLFSSLHFSSLPFPDAKCLPQI